MAQVVQDTQPDPERRDAILAAIARSGMVVVGTQDLDLRATWTSQPVSGIGLAGFGDVVGRSEADLLPPDVADPILAEKRRILESGAGRRFDVALPTVDGTRYIDTWGEPLRDADGTITGVLTIAVDVTASRVEAEELRHSRERLADAEAIAQIGSWEIDPVAGTAEWSDGLYALYGIDREHAGEGATVFIDLLHPDDRPQMERVVTGAIETGGTFDAEHRVIRPDGHVRHVRTRGEALVGADGRTVRLSGTTQDITDTRIAEQALEQAAASITQGVAELQRAGRRERPRDEDLARLLTARQLEILALLAEGMTNAEIAARLFISEGTVKWHVGGILRALKLANRSQAVARYLRAG